MWVLIAPTAATPREQLVQQIIIGFGIMLLLIVVSWSLREWRKGVGGGRPLDAHRAACGISSRRNSI